MVGLSKVAFHCMKFTSYLWDSLNLKCSAQFKLACKHTNTDNSHPMCIAYNDEGLSSTSLLNNASVSSVLLEHLSKNWATASRQLEKKLLHETLRSFSVTNDELTSQGHHGPEETGCGQLCKVWGVGGLWMDGKNLVMSVWVKLLYPLFVKVLKMNMKIIILQILLL